MPKCTENTYIYFPKRCQKIKKWFSFSFIPKSLSWPVNGMKKGASTHSKQIHVWAAVKCPTNLHRFLHAKFYVPLVGAPTMNLFRIQSAWETPVEHLTEKHSIKYYEAVFFVPPPKIVKCSCSKEQRTESQTLHENFVLNLKKKKGNERAWCWK